MKELPKELTAELLGLVLNEDLADNVCIFHDNEIQISFKDRVDKINIDTLTRLMKEWCFINRSIIDVEMVLQSTIKYSATPSIQNTKHNFITFNSLTEFEAVLKATHWVAKEKGLIDAKKTS